MGNFNGQAEQDELIEQGHTEFCSFCQVYFGDPCICPSDRAADEAEARMENAMLHGLDS